MNEFHDFENQVYRDKQEVQGQSLNIEDDKTKKRKERAKKLEEQLNEKGVKLLRDKNITLAVTNYPTKRKKERPIQIKSVNDEMKSYQDKQKKKLEEYRSKVEEAKNTNKEEAETNIGVKTEKTGESKIYQRGIKADQRSNVGQKRSK